MSSDGGLVLACGYFLGAERAGGAGGKVFGTNSESFIFGITFLEDFFVVLVGLTPFAGGAVLAVGVPGLLVVG